MSGIKYMDEKEIEVVREEIAEMADEQLQSLLSRFKEGGMKTCIKLVEEELAKRGPADSTFIHINQPDFDRERDGAIMKIQEDLWNQAHAVIPTSISISCRAYNEGYKQALRDWSVGFDGKEWVGCSRTPIKEIIEEVDKIDKET